ncbi:hypothetical protein Leryth_025803 [Lithospermum erythrorhizon]|nr:hypothetical protein Leryth_025803 [Lithospermum erythrorhizon]
MFIQYDIDFNELIPSLPEELALECLTRLHYSVHQVAAQVCKKWRLVIKSKEFYDHRKQTGHTHVAACLVQALPVASEAKPVGHPSYGVSVFDPVCRSWDRVDPVSKYPNGLPLFCQLAHSEGNLILMGGWDPSSWEPVRDVFVYEFTTRKWTQHAPMPSKRSFFANGASGGRVYIAGGHDENKNALNSAWMFDIKNNEWTELTRMIEERDECQGLVIGSEFWVVSGYDTNNQGRFESSVQVLDLEIGQWHRVDDAWKMSHCPSCRVGIGENGNLFCWSEFNSAVQVAACGVDLGGRTLVTGSPYQGAPHGFFIVDKGYGQNGTLMKIDVPDEFSGFVQSGCFVEI